MWVDELERYVTEQLTRLDLLKEDEINPEPQDIVGRLKMALRNELEASELAASWIRSTPELDVKLGLARQAGDEAKHYRLIEGHLLRRGIDLSDFDPVGSGYGPMFQLLSALESTVERIAGAQFARECLALKKNQQFIEFCEAAGDDETAELYRDHIQRDEEWHVQLGRSVLERYAITPEQQAKARKAVESVLELAVTIQNKQLNELKVTHAPGC